MKYHDDKGILNGSGRNVSRRKVKIYYGRRIVDKSYASSSMIDTIKGDEYLAQECSE